MTDSNKYVLYIMLNSVLKLMWQWKQNWAGSMDPCVNTHRFG